MTRSSLFYDRFVRFPDNRLLHHVYGAKVRALTDSNSAVIALVSAAVVGALMVAAPAHADDTQDQIFLTSLEIRNISCASLPGCGGNDQLLSLGQALCIDLGKTRDPLVEANWLMTQQGFTKFQAAAVLGSAVGAYCPEWVPVLDQMAGG